MKKIILGLIAASGMLVACDPVEESGTFNIVTLSDTQVSDCIQFTVYKDEACTQVAGPGEGNFVKYVTSPATSVSIFNVDNGGNENILAWGPSGTFKLSPKRGSSPDQEVTVRFVDANNIKTDVKKTVSVWVKSDLEPELKLLLGEAGKKNWAWAEDGYEVWGNAGNTGAGSAFAAKNVDGKWWGVFASSELFDTQKDHCKGDESLAELDAAPGSYMQMDEDNNIISYTADGKQIRKASFQLKNYNPGRTDGWQLATLETSAPAVLWPYSINENGKQVNEFDVMYLDGNHMTLVYTKGNGAGSWGEITYWRFVNASPSTDVLENNGGKWSWANDGVEVWGNAGNTGNGAGFTRNTVDGKWWGVFDAAELEGQKNHAGDVLYGDESNDAYMVFADGKVTSYAADNSVIRSGKYELNIYPEGRFDNWELGKLTTSEPALLFPWSINEGGKAVTEFDVMYMDGGNIELVYTKGNGAGSWGEITFWRFGAK